MGRPAQSMIENSLRVLVFHVIRPSSEYGLSLLLLLRLCPFMFYGCSRCTLGTRRFGALMVLWV